MTAARRPKPASFSSRVTTWQARHGRHDLPWQGTRDPYRIWVSEIMLQQTRVATVIAYYQRFLEHYPVVAALASASQDEVMRLWSGLGYYARARNLHRAARIVVERHEGRFPVGVAEIEALPGIGRSTAAAIAVFATGGRHAILDGNVKRVLARHFGIGGAVAAPATLARLWEVAQGLVPARGVEAYTQGLMDLGAMICTRSRPDCAQCPLRTTCIARRDGRIDELPGRKRKRALPVRAIAMLVVVSRGEVLVEKRPPSGVWGGLWSLPETSVDADPAAWVAKRPGLRVSRTQALETFEHGFTHFTLRVTPWLMEVKGDAGTASEGGTSWLALQDAKGAALPAPVKRLLARLATGIAPSRPACARAGTGKGPKAARRRP